MVEKLIVSALLLVAMSGCASVKAGAEPADLSTASSPDLSTAVDLASAVRDQATAPTDLQGRDLAAPADLSPPPPDLTTTVSCDGTLCPASCVAACAIQSKVGVGFCSNDNCVCGCF